MSTESTRVLEFRFGEFVGLWFCWSASVTLGAVVGWSVAAMLGILTVGLGISVTGFIVGFFIAKAQSLCFGRFPLLTTSSVLGKDWLKATTVSSGLGLLVFAITFTVLADIYVRNVVGFPIVFGTWIGMASLSAAALAFTIVGVGQQRVLKRTMRNTRWWIPLSALSGTLGLYIGTSFLGHLISQTPGSDAGLATSFIFLLGVEMILVTFIWGSLTGLGYTLLVYLERSKEEEVY